MPADQVAPEALAETYRRFEVDGRADVKIAECGYIQRLDGHVGIETIVMKRDSSQANAVHSDAFTELVLRPGQAGRANCKADVSAASLDGVDDSPGFDNSREHQY
jgi:hypothetical protein